MELLLDGVYENHDNGIVGHNSYLSNTLAFEKQKKDIKWYKKLYKNKTHF